MKILVSGHALIMKEYQSFIDCLISGGNEILLVTPSEYLESGKYVRVDYETEKYEHLPVKTVFGKKGKQHLFFYLFSKSGKEKIRDFKPDVVYLYEEPCSTVTRQLIRLVRKYNRNVKIVLWTSDNFNRNYIREKGFFDPRGYWFELNRIYSYRNSDGIIATTRDSLAVLREKKYPGKIFLSSSHFINEKVFGSVSPFSNKSNFVIGYIGRFVSYKNVSVLIRAFGLLEKKVSGASLVLLGEGPEEDNYRSLIRELGIENIEIRPFVKYREIPSVFSSFSVFVLPSRNENGNSEKFGRVVIEAMACGIPVVVSDQGYLPVLAKDAGFVFSADNHEELADRLLELAMNPGLRIKAAQDGRKKIEKYYTAEKTAERFKIIFKTLLDDNSNKEYKLGPF